MTLPGKNGTSGYRIVYSEVIRQRVRQMQKGLPNPVARQRFREAFWSIHRRLWADPFEFGEPKYRLIHLRVVVRTGSFRPLVVSYAVHDVQPVVFIREFFLLSGQGY